MSIDRNLCSGEHTGFRIGLWDIFVGQVTPLEFVKGHDTIVEALDYYLKNVDWEIAEQPEWLWSSLFRYAYASLVKVGWAPDENGNYVDSTENS